MGTDYSKRKELPFLQTTCFNCYTCTGVFSDEKFWPCFVRPGNEIPLRAYVVSVMDNSLFSGKDQRSYYFLPNRAESISLLSRIVFALQLDTNIHTIIRRNDDDDCYCYYQYYYSYCSLFVFWGP